MPRLSPEEEANKKLFIGGLAYKTNDESLKNYFEKFGELVDFIVMTYPDTDRSRGFGFVTFKEEESLEKCMAADPHTLDGKVVEIKRAKPDGSRGSEFETDEDGSISLESRIMRKLYIGGLNASISEDDMKGYFENFGTVEDVVVMKFGDTGKSRGFGFVTFEKSSMVDECQKSRPHNINGVEVQTKRAMPKIDQTNPDSHLSVKKIFVGGLHEKATDEDIETYFNQFGEVKGVEQMTWNDTGKKRGFGFVEFDDSDIVDKVCLIGRHSIMGKKLEVKKALSKAQMKEKYNNQMAHGSRYEAAMMNSNMMQMQWMQMMQMMMDGGGNYGKGGNYGNKGRGGGGRGFSNAGSFGNDNRQRGFGDLHMGGGDFGSMSAMRGFGPMRGFSSSRDTHPYSKFGRMRR